EVEEEEEEEEHIASVDSTAVIPVVELVSSPEGTKSVLPPPSIDITTTGARILVRLQASVSLPSTVDVERLLALPTPPLSPLTSLSPPFAGERLARLTDPSVHPSPLLLPSSGWSRYEAGESSTTRPTGDQGTDYRFVSTVDFEARQQGIRDVGYGIKDTWIDPTEAVPAIAPTTVEEVNTRVVELAELHEHDIQDFYALLEDAQDGDSIDCGGGGLCCSSGMEPLYRTESGNLSQELQTHRDHIQQTAMAKLQETDHGRQVQLTETLRVIRDMRREMSDMQKELISQQEKLRRERQPGSDARFLDHQEVTGDMESHP
nr:hypothetical protein [Tanacetum cinerariifolium]